MTVMPLLPVDSEVESSVLYRQLRQKPPTVVGGEGTYLITSEGARVFDATSGAAVSCIGHSDERVKKAIVAQLEKIPYCYSLYFTNDAAERLSTYLSQSTGGQMSRAFIVSSGMYDIRRKCGYLLNHFFFFLNRN